MFVHSISLHNEGKKQLIAINSVPALVKLVQSKTPSIQINALKVVCGISENKTGRELLQDAVPIFTSLLAKISQTSSDTIKQQLKESLQGAIAIVTWKP